MTRQEFSKIAMAIKTYYPNAQILPNNAAMELWYQQLQDIPYNVCTLAVNKWVAINKWAPTIADIREYAAGIGGQESDWSEAWEELMKNIQVYGYYRVEEGKKALSDLTRKTVERNIPCLTRSPFPNPIVSCFRTAMSPMTNQISSW